VDPAYHRKGAYSTAAPAPADTAQRAQALRPREAARRAAELTNSFLEQAFEILQDHPVNLRRRDYGFLPGNFVLLRDAGHRLPGLRPLAELHGLQLGAVVEQPVERALASLSGMEVAKLSRPTGDLERDFNDWALRTDEALSSLDGAYVQIKAADAPSHDGDAEEKKRILGDIDRFYFGRLGELVDLDSLLVCVTADHATPVQLRVHTNDPVPVMVYGGLEPDGAGPFGETSAAKGGFGYIIGPELMPRLAQLARA
jgi:2,3-bisphosphoglycerate-independent phosphoglycerate mutase